MRLQVDNFNSEIFGIKMGNIVNVCNDDFEKKLTSLLVEAKESEYSHLTIKIDSNEKGIFNTAVKHGFVLADTLVEYVFVFNKSILPNIKHKCILRDCEMSDLKILKEIAYDSFKIDRFHTDESLDNALCDEYYSKWIENSYNGFAQKVIVAEFNGEVVGFTTGKVYDDDKYGHLVLSAVSDRARGLGIYTSMIHKGVQWMMDEHPEVNGLIVGTQINNLAVQKAWINLGFTVYSSTYVLQKYIGEGSNEV